MTSIFQDGALHPGRDANDAWWMAVRRRDEWGDDPRPAGDYGTRFDATRMVLELAPQPLAGDQPLSIDAVDAHGNAYRLDAARDRILYRRACDAGWAPLPGVGGRGAAVGRLRAPRALALDERGLLYVVDGENDRVQVLAFDEPRAARVLIVLEGLPDPRAVAVGATRIYVGLGDGSVQTYDRQFRRGPRFMASRPGAAPARIMALAITGDDLLTAVDADWSRLTRFDCRGHFVDELGFEAAPAPLQDALGRARFVLDGTRVVGPIDGGSDGLAWHQIVVDAELPDGTSVELQTWAADSLPAPPHVPPAPPVLPGAADWAPAEPVALSRASEQTAEFMRPVLSDTAQQQRWRHAPYLRGASLAHALAGSGPNGTAMFTLPPEVARVLRADDEIELRTSATITREIATITPRAARVSASGELGPGAFGAGTVVSLRERAGRVLDAAPVYTLAAGDALDLSAIDADGGGADIDLPHALAALLYPDDVVELVAGARRARVAIESLAPDALTVTLDTPVVGDFRAATLHLREAAGRLTLRSSAGWGAGFPPGSQVSVAHLAADGTLVSELRSVVWSDPDTATVWLDAAVDPAWVSLSPASAARATDRGRYLWIKFRLRGARDHLADGTARATPLIRGLRVVAPRLSYLRYLPALYSRRDDDDPSGALFLERFLALFEGRLTQIEARYEALAFLLNPEAADDDWIHYVASWFDLVFDPSWPRDRRARLLARIVELYRVRGTAEGICAFVEAYTGHRPQLIEGFQMRPRAGIVLGCEGVLGCAPLGQLDTAAAASAELLASYAHRFTLVAYVDHGADLASAETSLRALVDAAKPAHVEVNLRLALPQGRIGLESMIGVDFILAEERGQPGALGAGPTGSRLGRDARVSSARGAAQLSEHGGPALGSFSIL